jgi:hypothetical protein
VKWAAVIRSLLEAAPKRRLTLRKLHHQVLAHEAVAAAGHSAAAAERKVLRKVSSLTKLFEMDGEGVVVRLRKAWRY